MAQDSMKWGLRPAWRLAIAVVVGLILTTVTLAWPAIVRGDSPPEILNVEVTSSKDTYFYSPPLGDSGGTTYFNNDGKGAGQMITVTVVVSDDNPTTFSGGPAFGIEPSTNISTSYGITSTWSVSYTIQSNHNLQNGVPFTITDGHGYTDTATISFIRDVISPVVTVTNVTDPDYDLDGGELNATGNWYRTSLLTAGWSFTAAMTETGSGYASSLATWNHENSDYDQTITPTFDDFDTLNGTFTNVHTNTDGLVFFTLVVTDRVGNKGSASAIGLNLDGTPPYFSSPPPPPISYLDDTDSGGDGFDPAPGFYDDPSIDVVWLPASDSGGSGVAGYYLDTVSPPSTELFYTGTTGVVTVTGNYSEDFSVIYITSVDNVGNVGSDVGYIESTNVLRVREDPPRGGDIDIQEIVGGEYLYINDATQITEGTLYYNNIQPSAFRVIADTSYPPFIWGYPAYAPPWKVVFTPGWGESSNDERFDAPYTHTYSIDIDDPLETTDVFTVYFVNRAGNVQSVVIDAVQDIEAPQVTLTDVTDPQYDPDGDKLNSTGNWYRTSVLTTGWAFTAAITETGAGYASGLADWDHQVNDGNDQSIVPGFNGADTLSATFTNVDTNSDGTVQVTVVATDHVNNVGNDTLAIQLDGTPPSIDANTWAEDSEYLSLQGEVLYYNAAMPGTQTATVSGTTEDVTTEDVTGSGLDYVAFEQKPTKLTSDPVTQTTTGDWSSDYGFTQDTGEGADSVQVTVYDNVGNLVTHVYEYVGVSDQPSVTFDAVKEPGHDLPPYDPLDDIGNWYAATPSDNNSWWFEAVITPANNIDIVATKATWEHEAGPLYYLDLTPVSNSVEGTFPDVLNDPSGLVTVTLTITDDVNRVATATLLIRIDNDGPATSDDGWFESSPYLHADGSTLYFSHMMGTTQQVATLRGHTEDGPGGAGAASVTFSLMESLGPIIPDDSLPDWSIQYFVSISSTDLLSPVHVTTEDNLDNQTVMTYPYVLDDTPPSTPTNFIITTPPVTPGYYNTQSLGLSWNSSTDNIDGSGLLGYYLGTSEPPTSFYPPTTTTTWDTGADGTFTFYLAAGDNVANTSLTNTGPITVDTGAPVSWLRTTPDAREVRILVEWGAHDPPPGTWIVAYDVEYRITDTGSWQPWLTNTADTSAYFGPDTPIPIEFDTPYFFRVRARDYVGNQGDWIPEIGGNLGLRKVFLPHVLDNTDPSIPMAVFDGFETGAVVGWKTLGSLPVSVLSHPVPPANGNPPSGGTYAASLGNRGYGCGDTPVVPIGRATIQAYANVPASGTPYLRFDYRVLSYDTVRSKGGEWWDRLEVRVNYQVLARYGDPDPENLSCSNLYDSGWNQAEFDLSAYAGQIVILTFFNENHFDGYWNTYSYLDNIRIEVGP